jgi:cell division protein FtsB
MSIDTAFWLFFILPLVCLVLGGLIWEAVQSFNDDYQHNMKRLRQLSQENAELRDELARLRQR